MRIAHLPVASSSTLPPSELPALVGFAKSLVATAHAKAQSQATFMMVEARDYLEALPSVLDRAVAMSGANRGVYWALEGTRLLARAAHSKIVALLAIPDTPPTLRMERHRDVKAQMDLVLERITNAAELVIKPWPDTATVAAARTARYNAPHEAV